MTTNTTATSKTLFLSEWADRRTCRSGWTCFATFEEAKADQASIVEDGVLPDGIREVSAEFAEPGEEWRS